MKKIFLTILVVITTTFTSCITVAEDSKELEKKVQQLEKDVAELQKAVGVTPSSDTLATSKKQKNSEQQSPSEESKKSAQENTKSVETQAIEAVKYCLKMYCPKDTYNDIRSVPKSDGTIDVVVDFKSSIGFKTTTYNVSVYKGNEYKINEIAGLYGYFPHREKFPMK